ncbi:Hypothetical protein glysoja_018450 [Glycine soja]|nr:Hypothetical protein glysoja_018450 [Glycine soja]
MDDSYDMLQACKNAHHNAAVETHFLVADQEFLPMILFHVTLFCFGLFLLIYWFVCSSVDLVVSCLGLHWTNLPGAMIQSRLALKPDGLFLAVILGGETLKKLKIACTLAQMEREGGISPRLELIKHFRAMGETNALSQMNNILKRDTALATAAIYDSMFSAEDGTVPATFQVIKIEDSFLTKPVV